MNPNQLQNNQEALGVRKPKNELVSNVASQRYDEDAQGIANGRDACVKTILSLEPVFMQQQGRVAVQTNVAPMPQQIEPAHQYEYRGQIAPQERPGTIQSGQELQRRFVPMEAQAAPATPPPLDLQVRIAQLRQEIADQSQDKQDIVGQFGEAA